MVMELCPGGDLYARVEPSGPGLTQGEALRWMRQISHVVAHLHRAGIVHRDIKPENVLLDAQGDAKLCDFGLAVHVGHVSRSRVPGTASYMAPEALLDDRAGRPHHATCRQDVWSLGILLYAMLFADLPWDRAVIADPDFCKFAREGGVQRDIYPYTLLSNDLRTLLNRMLAVDPSKRCDIGDVIAFLNANRPWFAPPAQQAQAPAQGQRSDAADAGADAGADASSSSSTSSALKRGCARTATRSAEGVMDGATRRAADEARELEEEEAAAAVAIAAAKHSTAASPPIPGSPVAVAAAAAAASAAARRARAARRERREAQHKDNMPPPVVKRPAHHRAGSRRQLLAPRSSDGSGSSAQSKSSGISLDSLTSLASQLNIAGPASERPRLV